MSSKTDKVSQSYPEGLPKDYFRDVFSTNYPLIRNRVSFGKNYQITDGLFQSPLLSKDLKLGVDIKDDFTLLELRRDNLRIFRNGRIYRISLDGQMVSETLEETLWCTA